MKIRQEINMLNATSSAAAFTPGFINIDTTKYVNPTYYLEVVAKITSGSAAVQLNGTSGTPTYASATVTSTTYARVRSASFSPAAGLTAYRYALGANITVKAIRVIVIDNPTTLTSTQTQIEIGMEKTGLTSTNATKVVPDTTLTKYWKYTAANWDGTKTFSAEVCYLMASSKSSGTFVLQEDNGSFGAWADKVTIVNAGIAATQTLVRATFTPTDGRNYRIAYVVASSKSAATIFNAKIIVDQRGETIADSYSTDLSGGRTLGNASTQHYAGQSFLTTSAYSLTSISVSMQKTGSPTDNLSIELADGLNGSVLGTTGTILGSTLTTSPTTINFTFSTPVVLTDATTYYIRVLRSGAVDASNYYSLLGTASGGYAGGGTTVFNDGTGLWATSSGDREFAVYKLSGFTLLEPQYLLLNQADDNTTNKQAFPTLWDSTEWSSVTNVYKHAMDSDNASNSADLVDIDNSDTQVTNSSVTGANQQISAALTMPTTGHQIDTDMDNTTGVVAASRIIVASTVVTIPPIPNKVIQVKQSINRGANF